MKMCRPLFPPRPGMWQVRDLPGVHLSKYSDGWRIVPLAPEKISLVEQATLTMRALFNEGLMEQRFPTRRDALQALEVWMEMRHG